MTRVFHRLHRLRRRPGTAKLYHSRPRRLGARRAVTVLIVSIVASVSNASAQDADREAALNRALSRDLVQESTRLQRSGDEETARSIARRALEIDPGYAPARLRVASFLRDDQAATMRHVTLLESALEGDLSASERREAAVMLAHAYLRIGAADRARALLEREILRDENLVLAWRDTEAMEFFPERLGNASSRPPLNDAEVLFLQAIIDGGGSRRRTAAFLRETRGRFPRDPRVAAVDWERHDSLSLEALEWLDAIPQSTDDAYIGTLRRFVVIAPAGVLRERLAYRYYALGGDDPLPYAIGAPAEAERIGPDSTDPVWMRAESLYREALRRGDKYLLERSGSAGGESAVPTPELLWRDADRDGFHEELYLFADGRLSVWRTDTDEDGLSEVALTTEGTALTLWYRWDRTVEAYTYARYPRLTEARRFVIRPPSMGIDGAAVPESVETALRWTPPEPFDLDLPVEVIRREETAIGLEEGIRRWGSLPDWLRATDRVVATGRPPRSLDRQFRDTPVARDESETILRELGLLR